MQYVGFLKMKKKIQIELTKEQFSRLQHMQSVYMSLLAQFKFQIPNYAKVQEKAVEMDKFLMELRVMFDKDDDIAKAKTISPDYVIWPGLLFLTGVLRVSLR